MFSTLPDYLIIFSLFSNLVFQKRLIHYCPLTLLTIDSLRHYYIQAKSHRLGLVPNATRRLKRKNAS